MERDAKIYVAGHRGLVGSAIVRCLRTHGYENLVLRSRSELDLTDQSNTDLFFARERPEYVFLAAAKVGGILANNTYRAQFVRENLAIALNVIHAAANHRVRKLLNLGSSCIYPRDAEQPIREEALLTGPLEPTNRPYAVAKIAAIELCDAYRAELGCDFISAMPTSLYGRGDNYDPETSHVIPALIRAFCDAKDSGADTVTLWGTGSPKREFLHVDDLAEACLLLMERYSCPGPINVGSGHEVTIFELAEIVRDVVGCSAAIKWDETKPDGTPRKLLESSRIRSLGWTPKWRLFEGLMATVEAYRS